MKMSMKKSDMAKEVMQCVKGPLDRAQAKSISAQASLAQSETGKRLWDNANPDAGVGGPFTGNPYNPVAEKENCKNTTDELKYWETVYEFAQDTFLDMI